MRLPIRHIGMPKEKRFSFGWCTGLSIPRDAKNQCIVHKEGVEPSRSYPPDPKSGASTIPPLVLIVSSVGVEPTRLSAPGFKSSTSTVSSRGQKNLHISHSLCRYQTDIDMVRLSYCRTFHGMLWFLEYAVLRISVMRPENSSCW